MRGQVVVRELDAPASPLLWTPDPRARDVSTHRGIVLGLGPPARLTESPNSPEVPHGFEVGAVVQYHFAAMGTQEARTRAWTDGGAATWLVQAEIDAVWEAEQWCGEECPSGPYAGNVCTRPEGHGGGHEIWDGGETLWTWGAGVEPRS